MNDCDKVVMLKQKQEPVYHFLSRYFAPWNGIPGDPVTGSAHTVLASSSVAILTSGLSDLGDNRTEDF